MVSSNHRLLDHLEHSKTGLFLLARTFENRNIQNPTFKKSGFRMFPDFEGSVFGSPLYCIFLALHTDTKNLCAGGS